jgi:hypothetical protein
VSTKIFRQKFVDQLPVDKILSTNKIFTIFSFCSVSSLPNKSLFHYSSSSSWLSCYNYNQIKNEIDSSGEDISNRYNWTLTFYEAVKQINNFIRTYSSSIGIDGVLFLTSIQHNIVYEQMIMQFRHKNELDYIT